MFVFDDLVEVADQSIQRCCARSLGHLLLALKGRTMS